jgi:hypothetical protein
MLEIDKETLSMEAKMKNMYFKALATISLIGSISLQAQPLLGRFLRTATPIALGATAGYSVTNDVTNAVNAKQYGTAAELTTLATLSTGITAYMGTLINIQSRAIDACTPHPIESGSLAHLNQRLGLLARSARLGSLTALFTPIAMLGQRVYNGQSQSK